MQLSLRYWHYLCTKFCENWLKLLDVIFTHIYLIENPQQLVPVQQLYIERAVTFTWTCH